MKNPDDGEVQASERYDRQLRIWGEGGQARLQNAKVLVLGSSATLGETLRNLVLPGIGQFVVIDDAKVLLSDLSESYLVSPEDKGSFKCYAMAKWATDLNPAVYGEAWGLSPREYLLHYARPGRECGCEKKCPTAVRFSFSGNTHGSEACCPPPVSEFSLVISSLMSTEDERRLLEICSKCGSPSDPAKGSAPENCGTATNVEKFHLSRQVPLVSVGSLGFFGWVRLWAGEYCLVDTKPEASVADLRIANPFPELLQFACSFDLESLDDVQHCHVPFIVILIQAVCRYRGMTPDAASAAASKGHLQDMFTFPLPQDAKQKICDIVVQMRRSEQEPNFQEALENAFRAVDPAPHDKAVKERIFQIMKEASTMKNPPKAFWRLARALHRMYTSQKTLPVCRLTMDMTADTTTYVALQRIYAQKAEQDEQMLRGLLDDEEPNVPDRIRNSPVSAEELQCFCRNTTNITVTR